jgi:hypothetical protein
MNTYVVLINGEPFLVNGFTADDAERVALLHYEGLVTTVTIRLADEEDRRWARAVNAQAPYQDTQRH